MTLDELLIKLGRQTIRIGSSEACEICLTGSQVPAVAAEIVHHGSGKLSFIPSNHTSSQAGDKILEPSVPVPFDFSIRYRIEGVTIPNAHPDLCLMMMSRGHITPKSDELIVGRDPERCHIVMNSPGVSGIHASFRCGPQIEILDHSSKSGTWVGGARLTPGVFHPAEDDAVLALGPLPLPISLVRDIHEALAREASAPEVVRRTEAMPMQTVERRALPSRLPTPPPTRNRTVMGTVRMSQATTFTVGRTAGNAIVLDYPQISAEHAKLLQVNGEIYVEDLGSELGTQVRGSRLRLGQRARVSDGERVLFGPIPTIVQITGDAVELIVEDQKGWAGRPLFDLAAAGITVQVQDRDDPKKMKCLLSDVHFKAQPGDLVALMGPSGSGKTTLLHVLTGYIRPSSGEVLVNDTPLPEIFESLRGSIGYVPQDDIIHSELTVYEAVKYSARFRLPNDYQDDEIERRVQLTLAQLGLDSVAHLQIGRPEHKVLSGGQRKRVNIAIELVTDPVLLFLDEPTSGLAADDTTALVDLLANLARDSGKTIVATIHQPARDEYEKFNLALVLGHGGIPIYFGPTTEAYGFFESWRGPLHTLGVRNPRDMFAELKEREARLEKDLPGRTRQQVREAVAQAFSHEYLRSEVFAEMKRAGRSTDRMSAHLSKLPQRNHAQGQLRLLISRYLKVKQRDRVGTTILLLQAPLIAILLSLVFGAQKPAVPYWCLGALNELSQANGRVMKASSEVLSSLEKTTDNAGAIFFLVVAAVWFGTSNAAREIVSERAIFQRERMVNLQVSRYVLSKFIVLAGLSAIQCAILLGIVFGSLGLSGGTEAFSIALGMMVLTAVSSVALGLLLSAAVLSSEAAMALTPIALIPQVVLGGLMVPVTTNRWLKWPMQLVPSRWGFEGVIRPEREAISLSQQWMIHLPGAPDSFSDFISGEHFYCALAQMESSQLTGAWGFSGAHYLPPLALSAMTVALLATVAVVLKRR